jgi:ribonuclease E
MAMATEGVGPSAERRTTEDAAPTPMPAESPAPATPPAPFVLPVGSLQQLADGAGLIWVHSDPDRVRQVQEAIAAEAPPVHVPRERRPLVVEDVGPLVLVETRRDLSQMKLPFETTAG